MLIEIYFELLHGYLSLFNEYFHQSTVIDYISYKHIEFNVKTLGGLPSQKYLSRDHWKKNCWKSLFFNKWVLYC